MARKRGGRKRKGKEKSGALRREQGGDPYWVTPYERDILAQCGLTVEGARRNNVNMDGALAMCHERLGIRSPDSDQESSDDGHDDSGSNKAGPLASSQGRGTEPGMSAPTSTKGQGRSDGQATKPASPARSQSTQDPRHCEGEDLPELAQRSSGVRSRLRPPVRPPLPRTGNSAATAKAPVVLHPGADRRAAKEGSARGKADSSVGRPSSRRDDKRGGHQASPRDGRDRKTHVYEQAPDGGAGDIKKSGAERRRQGEGAFVTPYERDILARCNFTVQGAEHNHMFMDLALAMCYRLLGIRSPDSDQDFSPVDDHADNGSEDASSTSSLPRGKARETAESAPTSGRRKRRSEDQVVPPTGTRKRQRTTGSDLYRYPAGALPELGQRTDRGGPQPPDLPQSRFSQRYHGSTEAHETQLSPDSEKTLVEARPPARNRSLSRNETRVDDERRPEQALLLPYRYIVELGLGDRFAGSQALLDADEGLFVRLWHQWIDHCEALRASAAAEAQRKAGSKEGPGSGSAS